MNSLDDSNDSDSELIGNNDSIIGEILIQMKSEFNKSVDPSIIKNKIVNNQVNTSESIDTAKDNCLPQESTVTEEFVTKSVTNISTKSIENVENSLDKEVSNNIANGNNQSNETTENGNKTNFVNNTEDKVVHIEQEEIVQRKTKAKINNTILSNRNEMHEEENELLTEDKNLTVREKKKEDNIRPRCRSSLRNKLTVENPGLKRSSRRLSKDFGETVLQSAIARKEKSYNETVKPQRLSRRLKPKKLNNTETPPKSPRNKRRNSISEKIKSNDENNSNENISTSLENNSLLPQSNENLSEIISENIDSDIKEKTPPKKNKNVKNLRLPKKNVEAVIDNAILTIENTSNQIESISNEIENPSDTIDNKLSPEILENDNAIPLISLSAEAKKPLTRRKTSDSDSKNVLENALPTIVRRRSHRQTTSPQQVDQTDKLPPDQSKSPPAIPQLEGLKTCLCLKRTQIEIEISNGNEMFCTAVDSVSGKCIGCNNMADISDIRRPSNRVPFLILCTVHFQRIIRHNCCPGCGMFCTEGTFICCKNGHQYHRECASIIDVTYEGQHLEERPLQCLHCGLIENQKEVQLIMKSSIKLAFLPFQRSYYPAAKMKIQYIEDDQYKMVEDNGYYLENENYKKLSKLCTNKTDNGFLFTSEDLYEAAETGDIEKLSEIIASGIDLQQSIDSHDGDTALHAACTGGHKIAAYMLLVAGASVNVINNGQKTPLMNAILGFHEEMLYFLIKNGAKISFKGPDGMTALHLAAKIGFLNGCKILVSSSNNDKQFIDEKDDGGWTPLVWACEHAHGDIARFLLWRGADPQIRDLEHNVPLHWAAFGGNYETIDLLLSLGVDVNAKNVHKESPLHIAARQDRYDCIIILLAHKAIPDYVNSDGETPLDCCGEKSQKCRDIISLNIQLRAMFSNVPSKDPVLAYDISNGKELNPIQCINSCDDEPKPSDFIYITENCITADIRIDRKVTTLQFCRCEDKCGTPSCQCNNISLRCWYDDQERLLPEFDYLDPPMIFECNQMCSCNTITCKNRVVQKGLTQRFQIFRTKTKGWGVKTLRFIKRGTYVCEYIGEILSDLEADQREDDSYLFDLDSRVCTIGYGILTKEGETYCIDARKYGNLARFINHHCSPNLLPVRVFIDHQDLHFPRIAFFANRDIAADEELGFDYGEKFWIIKCKSFTCTCGASNCRYSDATIESTLKVYQLREEQINLQQQQLLLQLNK